MRRLVARIIFAAMVFFNCSNAIGEPARSSVDILKQTNSDGTQEFSFTSLSAKDVKLSKQFKRQAVTHAFVHFPSQTSN